MATMPSPTSRFSRVERVSNTCGIWNERQMPSRVMRRGAIPVMSRPRKRMVPEVGFR